MIFTSFEFAVFFTVVLLFYFAVPARYKWLWLLAGGYFFYGWNKPELLPLLIIPTIIIYIAAIKISASGSPRARKRWFLGGLTLCLLELFAFKYLDLFAEPVARLTGLLPANAPYQPIMLILPIGLSFYIFKSISYLTDVYRGISPVEKHPGYLALYVSFFPQILAGPIDRAAQLIPELKQKVGFDFQRVMDGFKLITWGLFKKLVIADRLALIVDNVYNSVQTRNGPELIAATLLYSIQIYCDFSAYSDIAVGIAKILGFKSTENFDAPYFSVNIVKFWSKWHISLSTWLRDYLFLPLSYAVMRRIRGERFMNVKVENWGYVTGMFITMLLGGLWHGARWSLILWGAIHGVYLAVSFLTKKFRKKVIKKLSVNQSSPLRRFIQIATTFSLVSFAWIFFRAASTGDAFYVITHLHIDTLGFIRKVIGNLIFDLNLGPVSHFLKNMGAQPFEFALILVAVLILGIIDFGKRNGDFWARLQSRPAPVRFAVYYLLIMAVFLFSRLDGGQFIYFQF